MKIVYKVPIQDKIMDAVLNADIHCKTIDHILLDKQEARKFKAHLRSSDGWMSGCCSLRNLNTSCNMYDGVRIMEEEPFKEIAGWVKVEKYTEQEKQGYQIKGERPVCGNCMHVDNYGYYDMSRCSLGKFPVRCDYGTCKLHEWRK